MKTASTQRLHAGAPRPVFLNLWRITMPVGAVTSILHRVTGVVLAAGVPLGMYLLWRSLASEQGFAQVTTLLRHALFRPVVILLVWALAHHLMAGVRHMLTDINVGSTLHSARRTAWAVNLAAAAVALLVLGVLL